MYTIYIEDLTIEAIIGILDFERQKSQVVVIDALLTYEREGDTFLNYAEVVSLLERVLVDGKFFLLEEALEVLLVTLQREFPILKSVKLKLKKPNILPNCTVSVEKVRIY